MSTITIATPKTTTPLAGIRAHVATWRKARAAKALVREAAEITGGQLTIAGLMSYLGADDDLIRRYAPRLGHLAAEAYRAATGQEPQQTAAVIVRGRLHMINAYGWNHLSMLIGVAGQYTNTAALVAKIGI